ncbi:MAG: hypothetical protein ABI321_05745 [Polyangia bacterium]
MRSLSMGLLVCAPRLASTAAARRPDPDDEGDYGGALIEFERAQKVKPFPALDYNIGRCHDRLEHLDQAIAHYRSNLSAAPAGAARAEVTARISALEAHAAEARRPAPPPVPPPA